MKSLKGVLIMAFVFAVGLLVSGSSFAKNHHTVEGKRNHAAKVKVLNDAAAALEKSNPDLAKQLKAFADEEANETKATEKNEVKHEDRATLLNDSAAALEKSNPKLAKELKEMAEKNEKEEVGEKTEPKNEKNEK